MIVDDEEDEGAVNVAAAQQQAAKIPVSRQLVTNTLRFLRNVIVIDNDDKKATAAALELIYAERIQDALLLACILPFADVLEQTWLDGGDAALDEFLEMLAEAVATIYTLAYNDEKFCLDISKSENVCRALLSALTVQVDMWNEIKNMSVVSNILQLFYLCLQRDATSDAKFARLFVHLLRPIWSNFADSIIILTIKNPATRGALSSPSMHQQQTAIKTLMEIVYVMLLGRCGPAFQDLLELPIAPTPCADEHEDAEQPTTTMLDLILSQRLIQRRNNNNNDDDLRHLMRLMQLSSKARHFIVATGEIESTIRSIRSLHADLKETYRGPMRVLSSPESQNPLTALEIERMTQWMKLLQQMMYNNVEAKRLSAECGVVQIIIRLWSTLMYRKMKNNNFDGSSSSKQNKKENLKMTKLLATLRSVVLQLLMTFTAGCNDAGRAMVQPLYTGKPCSPSLLQIILRDLQHQLSRTTLTTDLEHIGILFGIVCQCAFYSPCRVLIRLQPRLLRTVPLDQLSTNNATSAAFENFSSEEPTADATTVLQGSGGTLAGVERRTVISTAGKPFAQKSSTNSLSNNCSRDSLLFESTVRNLMFDLIVCLSYSEDGQFFICAALPQPTTIATTEADSSEIVKHVLLMSTASKQHSAINILYDIARQPEVFGVRAHGSALLVLRNFCLNKALLARVAGIQSIMSFLLKFVVLGRHGATVANSSSSASDGVRDERAHILATSILIELCANRRKLHKEFKKMEIDLDSIISFSDDEQHVVLLKKLQKVLTQAPYRRVRRVRRGVVHANMGDVEHYAVRLPKDDHMNDDDAYYYKAENAAQE